MFDFLVPSADLSSSFFALTAVTRFASAAALRAATSIALRAASVVAPFISASI